MSGKKYDRTVFQSLSMISQFGITMLVPVCICSFLGYCIDQKFGTSFWMIVFFFVGALGGFRGVYSLARGIYKNDRNRKDDTKK